MSSDWSRPLGSSEDLVQLVLTDCRLMKDVGKELQRRPPAPEPARRLIAAYRSGTAPAWLTAYLLGCIGHETGYETVRAILIADARGSGGDYAGTALAKIRGLRAFDELRRIVFEGPERASREGAAGGLSDIPSPETIATLVEASVLGRIRYQWGASLLLKMQIPAEMVRELLVSEEPNRLRLGMEIVWSAFTLAPEWIERAATLLATPLHQAMDACSFFIGARKRKELSTWLAARPA